jgi:hypothetical protein
MLTSAVVRYLQEQFLFVYEYKVRAFGPREEYSFRVLQNDFPRSAYGFNTENITRGRYITLITSFIIYTAYENY